MTDVLRVVKATGIVTVQDLGWSAGRAVGVPLGGAMDDAALRIGNALVGNDDALAGLEWILGDFTVELVRPTRFALTGAVGRVLLDGTSIEPWRAHQGAAGQRLSLDRPAGGRFGYLSVDGGIAVEPTLGSRATYLPTAMGGWHGRRLTADDLIPIGPATVGPAPGAIGSPIDPPAEDPIRITGAPQSHLFPARSFEILGGAPYRTTPASDRMGTRLEGEPLAILTRASLPSEATCVGAIQVPDGGQPIVVLRDGPTVGGYPKIGSVIGADLARFSQVPPGESVRFRWVSVPEAQRAARARAGQLTAALTAIRRLR